MNKIETTISGCYELQPRVFADARGRLVKTFHDETFLDLGLETNFTEEYYSVSKKGVLPIRFHRYIMQLPPNDHVKCVTCISGKIFDVVVDLRKDSPTYKKNFCIELDAEVGNMLYIPKGLAHGFYVISEEAIFLNRTTVVYKPESDTGVKWDSCDIKWPNPTPILSDKDKLMIELEKFESPF